MKYFLFCMATFLLMGCGGNLVLDNPRSESAEFIFDGGNSHSVPADSRTTISMEPGKHTVQVKVGSEVVADTSFNLKEAGLVHSASSNYVVWRQLYGLQNERQTLLNERWVEFDSIKAYGDLKVYKPEWVFIEQNWDYTLDDELPDAKTLYITSDFVIESKIFRSKEFVKTYREKAQEANPE